MTQAIKAGQRDRRDSATSPSWEDTRVEPVDLSLVLQDCGETLRPLREKAEVQLQFETPDGLALVLANPKHLEIIFGNLIKNAIESIQMAHKRPANAACGFPSAGRESSRKSASGIPASASSRKNLPRIFERSFTTKGVYGTASGLFLTKQLVGRIRRQDRRFQHRKPGATFSIQLPLYNPQNPKPYKRRSAGRARSPRRGRLSPY